MSTPYAEEYERDVATIKRVLEDHERLLDSRFCTCGWSEGDGYLLVDHQAGMSVMALRASFRF